VQLTAKVSRREVVSKESDLELDLDRWGSTPGAMIPQQQDYE
jgi:hypothetical protein